MPERSSISQVVQLGVEATPGTAVAASKRLQSMGIEPSPNLETSQFRPAGSKYNTLSIAGKEWTTAAITGRPVFDEIIYPLASVLTTPVVSGAGVAKTWTFTPSAVSEDNPKTFTVEQGSAFRAHRFVQALVTAFSLSFTRDAIEMGGTMLGEAIEDGIAMTGAPTVLPLVPVVPATVCVYLDDDFGDLGTTKLSRLLALEWGIADRFGPLWTIDCDEDSYAATIEQAPNLTTGMTMEADAAGMGLLVTARAGATKYMRIEAIGPVIDAGPDTYRLRIDMPVKVTETGGFSDEDGVYAVQWSTTGVDDGDFGGPLEVEVVNTTTAL